MPSTVQLAPTVFADYRAAGDALEAQGRRESGWILRDKLVLSFRDLRDSPLRVLCNGVPERHETREWADSNDLDTQHRFADLLSRIVQGSYLLIRCPVRLLVLKWYARVGDHCGACLSWSKNGWGGAGVAAPPVMVRWARAAERTTATWARTNAADLRRLAGQITALTDLLPAAHRPLGELHAALAHDDPADLIAP